MSSRLGSDEWHEVPVERPFALTLVPLADTLFLRDRSDPDAEFLAPVDDPELRAPTPCNEREVVSSPHALWTTCPAATATCSS